MIKLNSKTGPLLIMTAGALWALDALIRTQLTFNIPSSAIVLFEHLIGFIFLSPLFFRNLKKFNSLKVKDWLLLLLLTVLSSVAGTIMFTEALARSFAVYDFASPILLQKLQPLFVVLLSYIFLREKVSIKFLALVPVALIASYMISFGAEPLSINFGGKEEIFVLSVGAAFAWGAGTILSKSILKKLTFAEATAARFMLAIPVAFIFTLVLNQSYPLTEINGEQLLRFIIIALTTGAAAILVYYRGLQLTPAKVATFCELTFPIISILIAVSNLNPFGEPQQLLLANVFGIILLLISILLISYDHSSNEALDTGTSTAR